MTGSTKLSGTTPGTRFGQFALAVLDPPFPSVPNVTFTHSIGYTNVWVGQKGKGFILFRMVGTEGTSFDWSGNISWTASI